MKYIKYVKENNTLYQIKNSSTGNGVEWEQRNHISTESNYVFIDPVFPLLVTRPNGIGPTGLRYECIIEIYEPK